MPKQSGNAKTAAALKDVLKYCLGDGQKTCRELGYIPLQEKVRSSAIQAAETIAR